ncbi:MAG: hypothetical protein WD407_07205 [Rhodospirillales bacterium]
MTKRKLDDWYYQYWEIQELYPKNLETDDKKIACWASDGRKFSRGFLLKLIDAGYEKWNKWFLSLPNIEWYRVKKEFF